MAKKPAWKHRFRRISQFFFLFALNPYIWVFRGFCFPAMNCWACPAAAFGCPVGAIGGFLAKGIVPFFAIGLMLLVGALVGRLICGWVCPFGLLQDLLAKIPVKKFQFPKALAYGKYVALALMVFAIPLMLGEDALATKDHAGHPLFFCTYCPAGTLEAAIPLRLGLKRPVADDAAADATAEAGEEAPAEKGGGMFDEPDEELWGDDDDNSGGDDPMAEGDNPGEDDMGGGLWDDDDDDDDDASGTDWLSGEDGASDGDEAALATAGASETFKFMTSTRMWILYGFILAFMFFRRPFCRGVCPIGAMFALLNKFSFFRMRVKVDLCKECNACTKKCPVDNKVYSSPGSDDCIRCLECMDSCKRGGVECGLVPVKKREGYWE